MPAPDRRRPPRLIDLTPLSAHTLIIGGLAERGSSASAMPRGRPGDETTWCRADRCRVRIAAANRRRHVRERRAGGCQFLWHRGLPGAGSLQHHSRGLLAASGWDALAVPAPGG